MATVPLNAYAHVTEPHWMYKQGDPPAGSYVRKPFPGYIETVKPVGGKDLMRLYKGTQRRYTDDVAEKDAWVADGWTYNARLGYLHPAGTPMTQPIHRLTWPADGYQVLICDKFQLRDLLAMGWVEERVLGNLTIARIDAYDTHKSLTYDPAAVVGDWETPGFSQYYKTSPQVVSSTSTELPTYERGITFVTSPRAQDGGDFAGRFALAGIGDTTVAHGDRAEVLLNQPQSKGFEGGDMWFGFQVLFPSDEFFFDQTNLGTSGAKGSVIFANVHQTNAAYQACQSPDGLHNIGGATWQLQVDAKTNPVQFRSQLIGGPLTGVIDAGGICLTETYSRVNFGPFTYDQWHKFVVHAHWTYDAPATGAFELWHNGTKVQDVPGKANLPDNKYIYWKNGIYRPQDLDKPSVLYFDSFKRGASYAEVAPS